MEMIAMPTDTERREVARRLRERAGKRVLNLHELLWCIGCDGDDAAAWNRLADLIEPSCDRGALLALADEMDADAGCHAYVDDYVVNDYARRIRKALEEES